MTDLEFEEVMANYNLLIAHVQKLTADYKTDHNQLQEKFQSAIWLLRQAAEELGRINYPNKKYPQTSIELFLEENDKS
jgi:hypothetical protein